MNRILITGGTGLIGKNLTNYFQKKEEQVLSVGSKYDLRDYHTANKLVSDFSPNIIVHLAAKVGGIFANNSNKADFYSDNVLINTNIVNAAVVNKVDYFFGMGTGCAYPKILEGKILYEEDFLDGVPEITNDAYAYAKRGLLVHLDAIKEKNNMKYAYCIPANIYGAYDNFHPTHSHVVPGLIRRFVETVNEKKESIDIWGNGQAKRDFLYIDDLISAIDILISNRFEGAINIATSKQTSINDLAKLIAELTNFKGNLNFDTNLPSGQSGREFSVEKILDLNWVPKVSLKEGLDKTIKWYKSNEAMIRER